jgi:hypothetical protein
MKTDLYDDDLIEDFPSDDYPYESLGLAEFFEAAERAQDMKAELQRYRVLFGDLHD